MLLGHGFEGDFDKAMLDRPRGHDGKLLPLGDFSEKSHELAEKLADTLERQDAKRAEKAKKTTSSQPVAIWRDLYKNLYAYPFC